MRVSRRIAGAPSGFPDGAREPASLRVLIVDEEFVIAPDLQDQAEALGRRVTVAARDVESGRTAELALMNLRRARNASGIDAARWLDEDPGVRRIFISGDREYAPRKVLAGSDPGDVPGKGKPRGVAAGLPEIMLRVAPEGGDQT